MSFRWISKHAVIAIHAEQIADYGGASGIYDEGALESALAKPKNLLSYAKPSVFDLAAAYGYGIVQGHPFTDGNKRTGLLVSALFLYLNGWELDAKEAVTADLIFRLADGKVTQKALSRWFEANCVKR
ncbi:Death on curing protein, Doc toxin [hydrothermal vent metagenome]|uniref:Death on curing protein, Doc toxin n=1 Tax=hydrothermal vent metagenome TaxID=652676 RepID=A0A3B1BWW1_9ZZZZ